MDDALCKMAEIQFFFSSVTGVARNKKRKQSTECEELNEGKDAKLEQQDSNSLINKRQKLRNQVSLRLMLTVQKQYRA